MDEIDRIGHRAADVLVAEVQRRIDVEDALQRLHTDRVTTLVAVEQPTNLHDRSRPSTRRMVQWLSAAAAVAALVVGGVVLWQRDDNPGVGPVDSVEVTPAPTSVDTSLPNTTPTESTTPPATTETLTPGVQQAVVTIDDSTPTLEGAVVGTLLIANTNPFSGAVTPSGRVFVGQMVAGAPYAELANGVPLSSPIEAPGGLRGGLDERLYALDPANGQLVTWISTDGQWTIDRTDPLPADCTVEVQPDAVRCGDLEIPTNPPADAPTVTWTDTMEVSVGNATDATTWQISIDSPDLPADCVDALRCQSYARYGRTGLAWTPGVTVDAHPDSQFVSLLTADAAPTSAWLECGAGCQIIGADANSIYTIGYETTNDGNSGVVARRFSFANIAAASSAPDPTAVDALADFPEPTFTTPDLAAVPMLLPTVGAPEGTTATRREYADTAAVAESDYEQIWYSEGDNSPTLSITTHLGQEPGVDGEPVPIDPWDRAFFFSGMGEGYTELVLQDPSGLVSIRSHGLTEDDLANIARTMHLRTDGQPGWQVDALPAGYTSVHEAWTQAAAMRAVTWAGPTGPTMEMWIATGINAFNSVWTPTSSVQFADIDGVTATVFDTAGRSAVLWSPEPGLTLLIGLYGSADDALAVARSLTPVDQATWEAASTVAPLPGDGCNSMFC